MTWRKKLGNFSCINMSNSSLESWRFLITKWQINKKIQCEVCHKLTIKFARFWWKFVEFLERLMSFSEFSNLLKERLSMTQRNWKIQHTFPHHTTNNPSDAVLQKASSSRLNCDPLQLLSAFFLFKNDAVLATVSFQNLHKCTARNQL